jgi:hypothetical protein
VLVVAVETKSLILVYVGLKYLLATQMHMLRMKCGWVPVAHTCNPSYSGCRDQEDLGSKPAQANSLRDPISKNTHHKKGWQSGSR